MVKIKTQIVEVIEYEQFINLRRYYLQQDKLINYYIAFEGEVVKYVLVLNRDK